jgi:hypothetical protein
MLGIKLSDQRTEIMVKALSVSVVCIRAAPQPNMTKGLGDGGLKNPYLRVRHDRGKKFNG